MYLSIDNFDLFTNCPKWCSYIKILICVLAFLKHYLQKLFIFHSNLQTENIEEKHVENFWDGKLGKLHNTTQTICFV